MLKFKAAFVFLYVVQSKKIKLQRNIEIA